MFGWPRAGTLTAMKSTVIVTFAALALLAAACGSGNQPSASASSSSAVAYSHCMRSHGVPAFPDPGSDGDVQKRTAAQLGISDSGYASAATACESLSPHQPASTAQLQQDLAEDVTFAQCMRSHGLPNFPDPTNDGKHVVFVISVSRNGFDPQSAAVLAKARACQHVLPAGSRLPSVTVTP